MLCYFHNWNIIKLSHKETYSEEINKIHQVLLDRICENMAALLQTSKRGAINTTDTATRRYYVIKLMSEPYKLQEEKMCNGKISTTGELVVKSQYINFMQDNTKWY